MLPVAFLGILHEVIPMAGMAMIGPVDLAVTWGDHALTHAAVQAGNFNVTVLDTTKAVVFDTAMPDTNYIVLIQPQTSITAAFWPTNLTTTGFTFNVSVGVNANFSYLATKI